MLFDALICYMQLKNLKKLLVSCHHQGWQETQNHAAGHIEYFGASVGDAFLDVGKDSQIVLTVGILLFNQYRKENRLLEGNMRKF